MPERIDPTKPNAKGMTIKDYLPMAMEKMGLKMPAGKQIQEEPVGGQAMPQTTKKGLDREALEKGIATLKKYKDAKRGFEERILEEEQWWRLRHWDVVRNQQPKKDDRPEPTSAWLFNSLANKHADIMDNFPEPNVLPREQEDEKDAQTLSSILPVIYERNNYEETYSDAGWYKLKHGVSATGTFWNKELEDGLGDIDVCFVDMLKIFWEPGITDLQDSRNLFLVELKDNDLLEQEYPQLKDNLGGHVIDVAQYANDDQKELDTTDKSVVVDWYYKKRTPEGRTILHFCKFCGNEILMSTENDPAKYPNGLYEHGQYPVDFDVLFPEEGTPTGFGYIALMKSPQMYIDKLSQVIMENAVMRTKPRYFGKKSMGINKEQFLDVNERIVDVEGEISDERLKLIEVPSLDTNVLNILQMKIDELKETSSNRDFSQGSTSSGVTAAAAIAALQEAGNKTSRDSITSSYRCYRNSNYKSIELIRQFYDEERSFRITGEIGYRFITYSNANLKGAPLPEAYAGQEKEEGYTPANRRPVFDIIVKPQKRSPYSKMSQNELAKEMFGMGLFNPQLAEQTMTALELMDFDGKEKVKERVQQGQTLMNQLMAMQQQLVELATLVAAERGMQVKSKPSGKARSSGRPPGPPAGGKGKSMGSAAKNAQTAIMTPYAQQMVSRATPNMETQR